MQQFSAKTADEELPYSWELSDVLEDFPAGETLDSGSVAVVAVLKGTDATPEAIISGTTAISGTKATQRIIGGVAGARYQLRLSAITTPGAFRIDEDALLDIRS